MANKHILERIAETNPDCEIWWDSSPLVYKTWARETIEMAPKDKRSIWSDQLHHLFNPERPSDTFFRGVTTNPPLSLSAIKDDPKYWAGFIRDLIEEFSDKGTEAIFWMTYKEIVKRGAEMIRPLWEKSGHKHGFVSGQVDPRFAYDYDVMYQQALELARLSPNVMVKCPGTLEGYKVLEKITSWGIATNNTSSFCVPQYVACMNAISRGLETARMNQVDLSGWRSVITHMSDRYSSLGDLRAQASARGIDLSEQDIRWGELAIFKRAYRILQERKHPSKMLMCSMRVSPAMADGTMASWHIEKITGGNVVYTCPPKFITELMEIEDKMRPFSAEAIHEEPPESTMSKLMRIPYYVQAYEPDGLTVEQFNRFAPLIATIAEFSTATRGMVDFVDQQFQAVGKQITPQQRPVSHDRIAVANL
jgi:transaldolase